MSSIQAPKGTFDVLPADAERRQQVQQTAAKVLERAGYRRIETPIFEATELFARGVGAATDIVQKEMYSFDDGGGRSLTLRPEGTAPIVRAYVDHGMHKLPQPVKFWYLGPFFRSEQPQKGRFRQFWQVGAEAIGSAAPETDAELIILLAELLEALGVTHTGLRLASLGTPETRLEYREELTAYLRAHVSELSEEVRGRIDLNPMRAFDASDPGTKRVMADAPKLLDRLSAEDAEHFQEVKELLDGAGLVYELDPTLVRGLDYYTRSLWEFTSSNLGAQTALGGGGRYDRLIEQIGGQPTPGAGWAAGIERILLAAAERPIAAQPVDLLVVTADRERREDRRVGFELAREARTAGLSAQFELTGRSLKSALKHADRIDARYVAIVNDREQTSLKDMDSGEQHELATGTVIPTILRGSRLV